MNVPAGRIVTQEIWILTPWIKALPIMNISLQFRTSKKINKKKKETHFWNQLSINRKCNKGRGDLFRRIWKLPQSIAEVSKNGLRTSPQQPAASIIPIDLNLEPTTFNLLGIILCQCHQSTAALPALLGFKTFSSISHYSFIPASTWQ